MTAPRQDKYFTVLRKMSDPFVWVVASIPLLTLCVMVGVISTGDVNW